MARGDGSSFGAALIAALADAADGTVGVRKSYRATGWHAQISKLTDSPRGYTAAAKAGLSVNHRTLVDWLAERREPNAANKALIDKAYRIMAGRWPVEVETRQISIKGEFGQGDDIRDRGANGTNPLHIDGSVGLWSRMRNAWNSGDVVAAEFEEWFIEDVIEQDIGEGSEPWEFQGSAYTVTL